MKFLPQYIQDLIGEFNVEHRQQMKMVFIEMLNIECSYCINMIERKNIEITHNGFVYCSVICAYNDKYCYSDTQYYYKRHLRLMKEIKEYPIISK
jgi:hypothetical protein